MYYIKCTWNDTKQFYEKKKKITYGRRAISVCTKTIMFTLTTNKIYANFKYYVVGSCNKCKKMYLLVSSKCIGANILLLYSVVIRGG